MSKHFPYPYLRFSCRIHDREFNAGGYVDTGYDGGLVIPESERIGMPTALAVIPIELGDGSRIYAPEYVGTISLEKKRLQATVLFLGNEYLIGRQSSINCDCVFITVNISKSKRNINLIRRRIYHGLYTQRRTKSDSRSRARFRAE